MTKITRIQPKPQLSLFWQRLIAFITVALVLFAAAFLFAGDASIRAMAIGAIPALVAWYTGKLYGEPVTAVTQKALMSMPPEKASLIIERSLHSMQPDIAAAIMERASHPPEPIGIELHGSEETKESQDRRES